MHLLRLITYSLSRARRSVFGTLKKDTHTHTHQFWATKWRVSVSEPNMEYFMGVISSDILQWSSSFGVWVVMR